MFSTYLGGAVQLSVFFADDQGFARDLRDPDEWFRWRVMANEGGEYDQVHPLAGWLDGDLTGDRMGLGEYRIEFSVGAAWEVGQYLVEVEALGTRQYRWAIRIEVTEKELPSLRSQNHLALVRDLREYGIAGTVPDYRIAEAVVRASRQIERYCGRVFSPRKAIQTLYGEEKGRLWFPNPCVWLQSMTAGSDVAMSFLGSKFFSRAMRTGPAFGEDDRDVSRIEMGGIAPKRPYWVIGVFGYTEADGSDIGQTPVQIQWATVATAALFLAAHSSGPAPIPVDRIIEEKTATQSYKLSDNKEWAEQVTSGDTEIARVLNGFRRPMQMGLV